MTTFSKINENRGAPKVVPLLPSMFADDWRNKPDEPIDIGLRLVSEGDIEKARAMSVESAVEHIKEPGEDRIDAYNDAIMRNLIARATCMPNDVRESFFDMPEDDVQAALTDDGVKFLFHEYDLLRVESCSFLAEADSDDLADLSATILDDEMWSKLEVGKRKRLLRILRHVLEELDPSVVAE